SKDTMATKVERWFLRAKADKKHTQFHLAVNPHLAEAISDNGTSRVQRMMKIHGFQINLVRDATIPLQEYKVYNAVTNDEITDDYRV
ncbi:MAG: hypothetical protein KAU36_05385, partial [candidate division Zixibacteria bacterium]|nr:hypothetical protein [candidate division Zixibacteria bacterium]